MSGATISVTRAGTSYPAAAKTHPHGRRRRRITQLAAIAGGSHARYVIAVIYGYRRLRRRRRCYNIELLIYRGCVQVYTRVTTLFRSFAI